MGSIGLPEILIVVAIAFVLFGGWRRLPRMARRAGRRVQESKTGLIDAKEEFKEGFQDGSPEPPSDERDATPR